MNVAPGATCPSAVRAISPAPDASLLGGRPTSSVAGANVRLGPFSPWAYVPLGQDPSCPQGGNGAERCTYETFLRAM
ncbi:hypothetical protein GCM10023221_09300 [Luteimicrobium xylanilyticum]